MSKNVSAGLLMFCRKDDYKFFLVHPGGPFFKNKDDGYWGIPKGLIEENEDHLNAAIREFEEETGVKPQAPYFDLGTIIQKGGKTVFGWAFETDNDTPFDITCNTCTVEWPPRSGKIITIPEVDKGEFFSLGQALIKINEAQKPFLYRLMEHNEIK